MVEIFLFFLTLTIGYIFIREYKNLEKTNFKKANNYLKVGEFNRAEKILLSLIQNSRNDNIQAMNELGKIYFFKGRYNESKTLFQNIYNLKSKNNDFFLIALRNLALIAEKEEDYDLVIDYGTKFEEIKNNKNVSKFNKVDGFDQIISRTYLKQGKIEESLEAIKKNTEKDFTNSARKIKQIGEIYLAIGRYKEAKTYFLKEELKSSNNEAKEIKHFLMMSLLGIKDYHNILEISKEEKLFLGKKQESLILGLYASGMANLKKGEENKAKEKFNKIFDVIFSSLNIQEFYKFYYYTFLAYYGLGKLEIAEKNFKEAEKYFQKIIEISEVIPNNRFKYFVEKTNLIFFKLLSCYELAILGDKLKINEAILLINSLTEKEKEYIEIKEIGNEGSVIQKINSLKKGNK